MAASAASISATFDAVFPTGTKAAKTRCELDVLTIWQETMQTPCVAIGGISPDNCRPLVEAGADFLAVCNGVWAHPDGPGAAVRAYLANFMVRNMDFAMMSQFFKHTMSLPFSFFARRKTGDIFARFQENQTIRAFLTESTVTTALNLLMVFIYFTIMFVYNVKMTLVLIAFAGW